MVTKGSSPPRSRKGCLVAAGIGAALVFLVWLFVLVPGFVDPRFAFRRTECRNNLKQLELALHNYHDDWGIFPPAVTRGLDGQPWHSWRVLLLPYLERQELYERYRFDEPWNGPSNQKLAAEFPALREFICPEEFHQGTTTCSYFAVVGERTAWPPDSALSVADIPDGTSRTLHLVEMSASGIHWMEPRDLPFESMTFRVNAKQGVGLRSRHGPSNWYWRLHYDTDTLAFAANADGSVRTVGVDTPPEMLKSLLLRDDGGPRESP